ncbi:DUF2336 domain-containing protein [Rhizobium straminoryzae]|uniref:DUF2336 domain-containing protein n=1 Tax=Rhizobium straminoryzae TaxID=1387186 RepID=A0A549TGN1_9HYPH|nr:DUF2336 domain-containing protein [Rhizobium straminoryzae]TRL41931.1 DUF2336 domain-containing protein [Rhizobium straminoryzae]
MIVRAFLRWAETAGAHDRARAAVALAQAFLRLGPEDPQRREAALAMLHLLDDPAPSVRRSLAETLAASSLAPRAIILALAEDQPDIACHVLTLSPVLTERDLVDLAGRGNRLIRGVIAARPNLGPGTAAAIAEIGDAGEILVLLENPRAAITRYALGRIAERLGHDGAVRARLLERRDLPAFAREILVRRVGDLLGRCPLVAALVEPARLGHLLQEAGDGAVLRIAGGCGPEDLDRLVQHLAASGRLSIVFLLRALVEGWIDVFAACVTALTGLEDRRVRSLMATGRHAALRALYESCGLSREVAEIFVQATLFWRRRAAEKNPLAEGSLLEELENCVPRPADPYAPVNELLQLIERMEATAERRRGRLIPQPDRFAA